MLVFSSGRRVRIANFLLAVAATLVGVTALWIALPLPAMVLSRGRGDGVTIVDRHGLPLRSTRAADGSNARWVPYAEIDPNIINAFIAVEDRHFWDHRGIDARAMARAVRDNLRARHVVSGGSTITMQLARLARPAARTWGGKVVQALWALRLERHLGKQQILEQYLNRVQLGQGTVGVQAASALYFGASASELSIGQAATLAGLAHAPSRDNPHVSPRRALARRSVALVRMRRLGYATRGDAARARQEPLVGTSPGTLFLAPHFTSHVLSWIAEGQPGAVGPGNLVRTSLDIELQTALEGEVRHTVSVLRDRGVLHAAIVVLDNSSGDVLAWVGSPDFWAPDNGQTDMVVSPRQPGSALKPFLYGLAFDRGYTAATVLPDIPKSFATATGPYRPRDYDRRFRGPTRAREALASSYNVPAVDLLSQMGTASMLHTLHLAGFESLQRDPEFYGLGLALGDGDVTLIELANAYRALANGGEWRPWTWRSTAPSIAGTSTSDSSPSGRVMSPIASAIVLDILADPVARIPGFGLSTPFDFPFPVAVKTGTSRHFTDNWAVATTHGFTVAVWAGNFSGRPMEGVNGVTGAGPLLHRAVMAVAQRVAPGVLSTPGSLGAVSVPVCRLSGLKATPDCAQLAEWFIPGTQPAQFDNWEHGGRITLPDEYAAWASQALRPMAGSAVATMRLATETDSVPKGDAPTRDARVVPSIPRGVPILMPKPAGFRIISPLNGDRYSIPVGVEAQFATISLRAGGIGASEVRWFVDGARYSRARWPLVPGEHVIAAVSARGDSATVRIVVGN
jgi:penicillin-binding protein 1C